MPEKSPDLRSSQESERGVKDGEKQPRLLRVWEAGQQSMKYP